MTSRHRAWIERMRSLGPLAGLNAAIFCGAVITFLLVARAVSGGHHLPGEETFLRSLHEGPADRHVAPGRLIEIARDVTAMGSMMVLTTVALIVAGYLVISRLFSAVAFLIVASLGGYGLNSWLKHHYERPRPDPALRWLEIDSFSFPSGHAMSSATIYFTLAVLLLRLTTSHREKIYLLGAAALLTFMVGFSRVYLGVHYPTDVIAGWAAGIAWAQLCWLATHLIGRRRLTKTATPA